MSKATKVSAPLHPHRKTARQALGSAGRSHLASGTSTLASALSCSRNVNIIMCCLLFVAIFFMYLAEDSIAHSNSHLDGSSHENSHDFDGHTALYKSIFSGIHKFSNELTLRFLALRGRTTHPAYTYGSDNVAVPVSTPAPINFNQLSKNEGKSELVETVTSLAVPILTPPPPSPPSSTKLSLKENVLAKNMQNKKPGMKGKKVEGGTTFVLHKRAQKASDWFDDPAKFDEGMYIELYPRYPGSKKGIRRDRVVNVSSIPYSLYPHFKSTSLPTQILGMPRSYRDTLAILNNHPLHSFVSTSLVESIVHLSLLPQCKNVPIFIGMATVGDELYWQLIENFVYSLVRFQLSQCALVICVSDSHCMELCDRYSFPCFDYQHHIDPKPSVMEQIANVKLFVIPQAMKLGVNIFMLDLDVGFLENPMILVHAFNESPIMDIFVQEDLIFIMNRTKAGWKKWFTEPLANIGMFLARGNNHTLEVFDISWQKYINMKDAQAKMNPGKDQNHVLDAMRYGRANFGLKYAYFTNKSAVLMDKVFKFKSTVLELGGKASSDFLGEDGYKTIAMHTTCYEHVTKVMGLKATNAFWHPRYFDPLTRTITKQLIYINTKQLLDEVRSLVWLGLLTNRSVIIPNILGSDKIPDDTIERYLGQRLWPGFRVLFLKRKNGKTIIPINILEPAFYWRVNRDYDIPPDPSILFFDPAKDDMNSILGMVKMSDSLPRIVLHASASSNISPDIVQLGENNKRWGEDRTPPDRRGLPPGTSFLRSRRLSVKSVINGFPPASDSELNSNLNSSDNSLLYMIKSKSELVLESEYGVDKERKLSDRSASYEVEERVSQWARCSVGLFARAFSSELLDYGIVPSVKATRRDTAYSSTSVMVINEMRTCEGIFSPLKGNRTCFQICD